MSEPRKGAKRAMMQRRRRPTGDILDPAWIGLLVFLGLCLFCGGSNLPSGAGLILLRPASILLIAMFLIVRRTGDRSMRIPGLFMAVLTLSIAIQLVPLPPGIWQSLPGHAGLAEASAIVGDDAIWRPISVAPGLTWSSLLATLTGWIIILAFSRLPQGRERTLVVVVIAMVCASCAFGLLQLIGGRNSSFYFYKSDGSISGLLANRNHQATLLAMTIPLLRIWAAQASPAAWQRRHVIAVLAAGVMLGMLLLTGSRSGLVSALIGVVAAYVIVPEGLRIGKRAGRFGTVARWGLMAMPLLLIVGVVSAGRDISIQRVVNTDYTTDIRLRSLPTTIALVKTYFPFGSGYGTFDPAFRMAEPDALLKPTFFNRAHNDFLELALTGGLLPVLLLVAGIGWVAYSAWRLRRSSWRTSGVAEARAGLVMLLILAQASVSDYPLRTPLIAALAMIAICWVARAAGQPKEARTDRPSVAEAAVRSGSGVM